MWCVLGSKALPPNPHEIDLSHFELLKVRRRRNTAEGEAAGGAAETRPNDANRDRIGSRNTEEEDTSAQSTRRKQQTERAMMRTRDGDLPPR